MIKFRFKNYLDCTESDYKYLEKINNYEDIQQQALEVSSHLEKNVRSIKAADGYFGTALYDVLSKTPRYIYFKNVGEDYDLEVDLITHTVSKLYHL